MPTLKRLNLILFLLTFIALSISSCATYYQKLAEFNGKIEAGNISEARILLEKGSLNVSEVAYQVGFNDPAYFTRAFKKQYGFAPKTFLTKK